MDKQQRALRGYRREDTDFDPKRIERINRENPYRDSIHYREGYSTTMSDEQFGVAEQNRIDFEKQIAASRRSVAANSQTLETARGDAMGQLNNSLPSSMTLNQAKADWEKTFVPLRVVDKWGNVTTIMMPGDKGPDAPHGIAAEFAHRLTAEGIPFENGAIQAGSFSTDVIEQMLELKLKANKAFYEAAGPQIGSYNASIGDARVTGTNAIGREYALAQGRLQAAQGSIQKAISARNQDLSQIRSSYQERLERINEALNLQAGKK